MKKKLSVLVLCSLVVSLFSGCSNVTGMTGNQEDISKIQEAYTNLQNLDKVYEIANIYQSPSENLCYLEVCNPDGSSYTEYSVDDNGSFGNTISRENSDFMLTDWITKDGEGYVLVGENEWLKYPNNYINTIKSRNIMYLDLMMDNLKNVSYLEDTTLSVGTGEESFSMYKANLSSDIVRKLLGIGSEELYKAIKEDTINENISKLCGFYLEDIDFTMKFSDANVYIGLSNNILRYVQLEVGGLGTRLYDTKAVVVEDINLRDEPDLSGALPYESSLKDIADYVSEYDTYDEALEALDNYDASTVEDQDDSTDSNDTEEDSDLNEEDIDN